MPLVDDFPLIEQLPPERGERKKKSVVVYSCCCCCCCCLHTLGAAVGAVLGGLPGKVADDNDPDAPIRFVGGMPVAKLVAEKPAEPPFVPSQWLYWSSFLILLLLALVIVPAFAMANAGAYRSPPQTLTEGLGVVLLTVVLAGPLCFLAAGILTAIRTAFIEDAAERNAHWKQLAWITGGIVIGTVVGILAMVFIGVFLSAM